MKIKTLKIKVETENQDFDFTEFLTGSNVIHTTEATLRKEKDGLYWHVFITYQPKGYDTYLDPRAVQEFPKGFEEEIYAFLHNNPPTKLRVKNAVVGGMRRLLKIRDIEGFKFLNQIGNNSLAQDQEFFTALLAIINKYQTPDDEN